MKSYIIILIISFLMFRSSVFSTEGGHGHDEQTGNKSAAINHNKANKEFDHALKKYEELYAAFFENNLKEVKLQAKSVLTAVGKIKDKKIQKLMPKTEIELKNIISKSQELKTSGESFGIISGEFRTVLHEGASNKDYSSYYCPMVKKYWVQNVAKLDKVMNPYSSQTMANCGMKE